LILVDLYCAGAHEISRGMQIDKLCVHLLPFERKARGADARTLHLLTG
jgi:hypothetical protein